LALKITILQEEVIGKDLPSKINYSKNGRTKLNILLEQKKDLCSAYRSTIIRYRIWQEIHAKSLTRNEDVVQ